MLRSMTGYGRGQATGGGFDITVDIKAVNHRYFEFAARLPKVFPFLEERLKALVQSAVNRGKVEVTVTAASVNGSDTEIVVNEAAAQAYVDALRKIRVKLDLQDDLKLSHLLRLPDVFTAKRAELDEDAVWTAVSGAARAALESFQHMREAEGARLKADLEAKLRQVEGLLAQVEEKAPTLRTDYYNRLYQRLSEVLADKNIDESRLITEAAIFADRVAVDEETVRLRRGACGEKAGFPGPGDEPGDQYHRLQGPEPGNRPGRGGNESGNRKNSGTDPEYRVRWRYEAH